MERYKVTPPKLIVVKGVRYPFGGDYKTPTGMAEGLVVHYTVSGRTARHAENVVRYLASKSLGAPVMDENGIIYVPENFDVIRHWAPHAGVSKWGERSGLSQYYAGLEICSWGRGSKDGPLRTSEGVANIIAGSYQAFTDAQEKALFDFCLWMMAVNPSFKLENVVGHDEIRAAAGKPGDKQDPGASLSVTMPELRAALIETFSRAYLSPA